MIKRIKQWRSWRKTKRSLQNGEVRYLYGVPVWVSRAILEEEKND